MVGAASAAPASPSAAAQRTAGSACVRGRATGRAPLLAWMIRFMGIPRLRLSFAHQPDRLADHGGAGSARGSEAEYVHVQARPGEAAGDVVALPIPAPFAGIAGRALGDEGVDQIPAHVQDVQGYAAAF